MVLTGPRESAAYFEHVRRFIVGTLGEEALRRFTIIIDDPAEVGRHMVRGMEAVRDFRKQRNDSYNFNCCCSPSSRNFNARSKSRTSRCARWRWRRDQPAHELAANLRRAFSGIVTGNVKEYGIKAIERAGPYELAGDPAIMALLDELLAAFVAQRRMKLPGSEYRPVYRLIA